jgi:hypothetical protein
MRRNTLVSSRVVFGQPAHFAAFSPATDLQDEEIGVSAAGLAPKVPRRTSGERVLRYW